VWWLSKEDYPKADVRRVLVPYSARMLKLIEDPGRFYTPKGRPSGHDVSHRFADVNGGAIPPNLLEIANTESNSPYLRLCKLGSIGGHPARFPEKLPAFFITLLTDPGDLVLDFFAGSNTTGAAAETAGRRWLAFDSSKEYLAASAFRFCAELSDARAVAFYNEIVEAPSRGTRVPQPQQRLAFSLGSETTSSDPARPRRSRRRRETSSTPIAPRPSR
jgi:site-specific DNA-methyltransferase (cytosine-N4-specific)